MKFGIALALVYPAAMAWLYFIVLPNDGAGQNPALVIAFTLGKSLQFALPLIFVGLFDRSSFRFPGVSEPRLATAREQTNIQTGINDGGLSTDAQSGVNVRRPWSAAWGILAGIAFALLVGAAMQALYHLWLKHSSLAASAPEKVLGKLREFGCDSVGRFVLLGCGISILHSLLEEYYWRWFIFGQLRRRCSFTLAAVVSGVGFMLHHIIVLSVYFPGVKPFWLLVMPFSLGVALGGGVWAWIYDWSGSFYAAWVSHCLIDAAIMVVGYEMVFRSAEAVAF